MRSYIPIRLALDHLSRPPLSLSHSLPIKLMPAGGSVAQCAITTRSAALAAAMSIFAMRSLSFWLYCGVGP